MLARLGWIGTALAAGLLLQIVVQINALHWLPEFPVYLALAMLAAVSAGLAAPALMLTKGLPPRRPSWRRTLAIAGFVPVTMVIHGLLAAKASSSAIEWWRNVALWPALLAGATACVLTGPGWRSLLFLWPLGEAAACILACWYAPSFGESSSWRGYQYVLVAALITAAFLLSLGLLEPRWRRRWSLWLLLAATFALPLICLIQPDTEAGQPWMLGVAVVRFGLLVIAVDRWLMDVVTGLEASREPESPPW
jgi:hypothetical protein